LFDEDLNCEGFEWAEVTSTTKRKKKKKELK
jgi:hypothetical protein